MHDDISNLTTIGRFALKIKLIRIGNNRIILVRLVHPLGIITFYIQMWLAIFITTYNGGLKEIPESFSNIAELFVIW